MKDDKKNTKTQPEKVAKPKPEKVAKAKPEKVAKPKPEKVAKAKPEKVAKAKPEKVAKPKPEKVAKPKPEKVAKPKPEKVAKAKPEKATKSKAEKVEKHKSEKTQKTKKEEKAKKPATKKETKKSGERKISKYLTGLLFAKMVRGGANELRSNAEEVNKLNVFPVPDGDTGDNMRMTIESGIAAIENLDSDDLADVMKVFSHGMLLGARGNSGVILSQLFAGMATSLQNSTQADTVAFAKSLQRGVEQAYSSVVTPVEGTILTVAREATEYAVSRLNPQSTIRSLLRDLVKEMKRSLDRTPEILVALKEAGVVDSGAAGLLYIMDGFNRVFNGEEIPEADVAPLATPAATSVLETSFGPDSVMTYGYCTELLLQLLRKKVDIDTFDVEPLKQYLLSIGDSVVCFKIDSIVKLHVHTKSPEKVLKYCRQFGEFLTVKIENMSVQHSDLGEAKTEEKEEPKKAEMPRKKHAIVTVSNGAGLSATFRELGADEIVEGGQTNNPSTQDFLEAYAKINAEHIFVLPNNSNIMMAAEQSAELYEDAKIHVLPAKNIGAGYAAISSADLESQSVDEIIEAMTEAIGRIETGYVSPSIRDAEMNGISIAEGDTIGIIAKEIVTANADRLVATTELIDKLITEDRFVLTCFYGKDSDPEEREQLEALIAEKYPDVETYFLDGTQEIYPYIFVAE